MLVKDCMTRHPIMIGPDAPATEAQKIMAENRIRHLPVVGDGKRLLGLMTNESLAMKTDQLGSLSVWDITRFLSNLKVKDVMLKSAAVHTIDSNRTVERAAKIMSDNKQRGLVVIDDGVVSGIITETDVMKALQEMLGLPKEGVRVTLRMPNRHGEFNKLTAVLSQKKWGIMGIGSFPTRKDDSTYDVVLKIPDVSIEEVKDALSQIETQKIVDIRDAA